MYHTLVEREFKEIKAICKDKIIPHIRNQDEIYLIDRTIGSMESALGQKAYFASYSPLFHLSEDLRPWHNVPAETLYNLERKIFDLGTAIKIQYGVIRNKITELQLNRIKSFIERNHSENTQKLLEHLIKNDPDLRKPIRELIEKKEKLKR